MFDLPDGIIIYRIVLLVSLALSVVNTRLYLDYHKNTKQPPVTISRRNSLRITSARIHVHINPNNHVGVGKLPLTDYGIKTGDVAYFGNGKPYTTNENCNKSIIK